MEYEFINDPTTRYAKAKFSLEHEVFGPWLEVEVGNSLEKLTALLSAIDKADNLSAHEQEIVGSEYTVRILEKDVSRNECLRVGGRTHTAVSAGTGRSELCRLYSLECH